MECVRKWGTLLDDGTFMCDMFSGAELLVKGFYGLTKVVEKNFFENAKVVFDASANIFCEVTMTSLKNSTGNAVVEDVRFTASDCHDEMLGLTQTQSTSSLGYKRRRYGAGDAPPSKQKKYSATDVPAQDFDDSGKSEEIFKVKPLIKSALSLIFGSLKHSQDVNLKQSILELLQDFDPAYISQLSKICAIFKNLSSICCILSEDDMLCVLDHFQQVFVHWYKDQYISAKFLDVLRQVISKYLSRDRVTVDSAVMEKVKSIFQIFWKCKQSGKTSFLLRFSLAAFLESIIQIENGLNSIISDDANPFSDVVDSLLSFCNDENDGIKYFAVDLVRNLCFINQDNHLLDRIQKKMLLFVKEIGQSISDCTNNDKTLTLISLSLHGMCAVMSHTSNQIEQEVHVQLCALSRFNAKLPIPDLGVTLISRCAGVLSKQAFTCTISKVSYSEKNLKYMCHHLQNTFHKWMEFGDQLLSDKMEAFPYKIFEYGSLNELYYEHVHEIFPVVISHCKSVSELEDIAVRYFWPQSKLETGAQPLISVTAECLADIISFIIHEKFCLDKVSKIIADIFQKQGSISAHGADHFGRILVNVLVKLSSMGKVLDTPDFEILNSALEILAKYFKIKPIKSGRSVRVQIASVILSKRKSECVLVQSFLCICKHVMRSWYPHEKAIIMTAFKNFVNLAFEGTSIPDDMASYLLTSTVYVVAHHVLLVYTSIDDVESKMGKENLIESCSTGMEVLNQVCAFMKTSKSDIVARVLENWDVIVPIVSTIANLNELAKKICDSTTQSTFIKFSKNVDPLKSVASNISGATVLQTLMAFTENTVVVEISTISRVFKNCFTILENHELLIGYNSLMDNICQSLGNAFRRAKTSESPTLELQNITSLILKVMQNYSKNIPSIFGCVVQAYYLMPECLEEKENPTSELTTEDLIWQVLEFLSNLSTNDNYSISKDASTCIYKLLGLPILAPFWGKINKENKNLAEFLYAFKVDIFDKEPVEVSIGIENFSYIHKTNEYIFGQSHNKWICEITTKLVEFCDSALFRALKPVLRSIPKLCSIILPSVVHDILVNDPTGRAKTILSAFMTSAFEEFLNPNKFVDLKSVSILLEVMRFLRTKDISEIGNKFRRRGATSESSKSTSWENNFWLEVSYLTAANVASCCHQPYTAILYSEIWQESNSSSSKARKKTCRSLVSTLNEQGETDMETPLGNCNGSDSQTLRSIKEKILVQAYSRINDVDSLHGLLQDSVDTSKLMMHIFEKENNWLEALHCYCDEIQNSTNDTDLRAKIYQSLKYCGLGPISGAQNEQISNRHLCSAQHLCKWGSSEITNLRNKLDDCMRFLGDEDPLLSKNLEHLRFLIADSISVASSISSSDVVRGVSNLVVLEEIHDAMNLVKNKEMSSLENTLENWDKNFRNSAFSCSYDCCDMITSKRESLLSILESKSLNASLPVVKKASAQNLSIQIENAALHGKEKLALNLLASFRNCVNPDSQDDILSFKHKEAILKEVELLWGMRKRSDAISRAENLEMVLRTVVRSGSKFKYGCGYLLGKVLQLQGEWMNETKMKAPSVIMETYFKKSVDLLEKLRERKLPDTTVVTNAQVQELCVSGYKALAKFSDAQYQEIIDYMKSSEFQHKRMLVKEAEEERKLAQLRSNPGQNQKYTVLLVKHFEMDKKDLKDILQRKENFLLSALENYIKCLRLTDEDDILMYRVCSLWFSNIQTPSISGFIDCARKELKTHKFIEMSYQLAARLGTGLHDDSFQSILRSLLSQTAIEHPHHVLPVLFALANAHKDDSLGLPKQKSTQATTQDPTSTATRCIINEVKRKLPGLVSIMSDLFDAYIQFANWNVSKYAKTTAPISFDKNLLLAKFCDTKLSEKFTSLAIPTVEIPVDKLGKYEGNFISLRSFKSYFKLCGGINLPKIIIADGSDGSERRHLVKGKDDLRQDAVMEQVFNVVNALLTRYEGPRKLKLRTYKVVPLSRRSGLVEWCEGTVPIGNYLIGVPAQKNYGAHHRYRPEDSLSLECRRKLAGASGRGLSQKLQTYRSICGSFKPVFRHFFYENFTEPSNWFHRRTAYCKSVAVSSIVGYILGLGDRHVQNILIDCKMGEVVHIDLGVAFEQGRCLPTPEMVPFRLTRDMVDGFGSAGVEGIFRRNCERTMSILQKSIDIISTIVEVLLYDPLHDWTMTKSKALQIQQQDANAESEMTSSILNASTVAELLQNETPNITVASGRSSLAGRALLRVNEKLRGLESGSVLSVEGQINLLIQQATDEEKLCAMYAGWQPYI